MNFKLSKCACTPQACPISTRTSLPQCCVISREEGVVSLGLLFFLSLIASFPPTFLSFTPSFLSSFPPPFLWSFLPSFLPSFFPFFLLPPFLPPSFLSSLFLSFLHFGSTAYFVGWIVRSCLTVHPRLASNSSSSHLLCTVHALQTHSTEPCLASPLCTSFNILNI